MLKLKCNVTKYNPLLDIETLYGREGDFVQFLESYPDEFNHSSCIYLVRTEFSRLPFLVNEDEVECAE